MRASRADRLPKFALTGLADYNRFDSTVQNTGPLDAFGFGLQNYAGFLTVQWPAFTGFADENKNRAATAAKSAAEAAAQAVKMANSANLIAKKAHSGKPQILREESA